MRHCAAGICIALLASSAAFADAYYNITSITSEQMANAVRVKIEADGAISASVSKWYSSYYVDREEIAKQQTGIWTAECYPRVSKICVHIDNARPQCGSVVHIGKYPVSHVELSFTPETGGRFGLDMVVVLHRLMRWRKFKLGDYDTYDAYLMDHHDPAWFEVIESDDQRSLIVTVASDQLPLAQHHRKAEDVEASDRELNVSAEDGLLDVSVRNATLTDVVEAISSAGADGMLVESGGERLVSAELHGISVREFAERISECYGLALTKTEHGWTFGDILARTAAAYFSGTTELIPVRWMKADRARQMLPSFLLDYLRVDEERNALTVSGPPEFVQKIRADLARIDQPANMVALDAVVIESASGVDLNRELALDYQGGEVGTSTDPALGELVFSTSALTESGLAARLTALEARQRIRVKSRSSVTVESGQTGEIFAGVEKYIQFRRRVYDTSDVVEPVSAGVKLSITPSTGGKHVTVGLTAEVRSVGEVDPATNLPVINTRSAAGAFLLSPGRTMVIGGLRQEETQTIRRKIPLLGNVPLIGKLFQKKIKRQNRADLTVLITPRVLNDTEAGKAHDDQAHAIAAEATAGSRRDEAAIERGGVRAGGPGPELRKLPGADLRDH